MISVLFTVVKFFFVFQKLYYRFLLYIIYFFQFYFHFRGTLSYKLTKNRKLLLATFFCLSMWVRWFNCQSCAVFFRLFARRFRFQSDLLVCVGCVLFYFGSHSRTHTPSRVVNSFSVWVCEWDCFGWKRGRFYKNMCFFFELRFSFVLNNIFLHGCVCVSGWKPM